MSRFRRYYVTGGTYFFTVVTYRRRPILVTELGRRCLREAIAEIRDLLAFELVAVCLLPDHMHAVWTLPPDDCDYSVRWKRIKHGFSTRWLALGGAEAEVSAAEKAEGRRGIWQARFWEHTVRDERDLERCVDYIHWNPRKHALVTRVQDWPYSSFHRFVGLGHYEPGWGGTNPTSASVAKQDWGEP